MSDADSASSSESVWIEGPKGKSRRATEAERTTKAPEWKQSDRHLRQLRRHAERFEEESNDHEGGGVDTDVGKPAPKNERGGTQTDQILTIRGASEQGNSRQDKHRLSNTGTESESDKKQSEYNERQELGAEKVSREKPGSSNRPSADHDMSKADRCSDDDIVQGQMFDMRIMSDKGSDTAQPSDPATDPEPSSDPQLLLERPASQTQPTFTHWREWMNHSNDLSHDLDEVKAQLRKARDGELGSTSINYYKNKRLLLLSDKIKCQRCLIKNHKAHSADSTAQSARTFAQNHLHNLTEELRSFVTLHHIFSTREEGQKLGAWSKELVSTEEAFAYNPGKHWTEFEYEA